MILALTAAGAASPASAQGQGQPAQILLRLEKGLTGRFLYWFTSPSLGSSPQRPLPAAGAEGYISLDLPAIYNQPGGQIIILDYQHGKLAHLPIRIAYREPFGPNLLQNPNFSTGLESWRPELGRDTAKGALEIREDPDLPADIKGNVARCVVSAIDKENWHVQFVQNNLELNEGEAYTLSFWAKADRERPLTVNACIDMVDYHDIGLRHQVTLKTDWHKYGVIFTASRTMKGQNRITFIFGDALGTVDLTGVSLRRGAVARPLGANLLKSGDFAQGQGEWAPLVVVPPAAATVTFAAGSLPSGAKGRAASFNVTALGKENYSIHFYQAGMDLQEGEPYTLAFWAKADRKRPLSVNTSVDKEDYRRTGLDTQVNLDTQWHRYIQVFTATRTVKNSTRLVFALADALGTVDLADISLQPGVESTVEEAVNRPSTLIKAADFNHVQSVKVPVKFQGRGVYGVLVQLKQQDKMLDQYSLKPSDQGMARFTDVPLDEKLTVHIELGEKTADFSRILASDMPGLLGQVDLPESWAAVNTVAAGPSQPHPLVGTWENQTPNPLQRYRFTFNADGTGSIQPATSATGGSPPKAPPANPFRWYLKEEGQRLVMSTKIYEWSISMEKTDTILTLKEKNGKTITMRRR